MRYTAFYLVEPRQALRERLKFVKDHEDLQDLLLDPVLLSRQEGGRSVWRNEDHVHAVKLLFLVQIKEYDPLSSDAMFEAVFGSPRLNAEVFDRWWTIRRLMEDDSAESLYPLLRRFYHLVDRTENDLVNQWLDWVRAGGGMRPV